MRAPRISILALGLAALSAGSLRAQAAADAPESLATALPPIYVIGIAPLSGAGIDADKVPSSVQTLSSQDLRREGPASLINGITDQLGSANMNGTMNDPFQPDILYRGFEASPVLGTPQGLAVYQNGVRINEAFGDTVNWDLFPDIAVDRVDVLGSNPVYGRNALGGAVVVNMKNGFTYQGLEGELTGGSFGQRGGSFEFGKRAGGFGAYIAGKAFDEDGWRQFSQDSLRQLYADFGWHGDRATIDVSFSGADNHLYGQGPAPVQELVVDRSLAFTGPQENSNQLAFLTLNGSYQPTDALTLQGNAYRREFLQNVSNGNTTEYVACSSGNGYLCQSDGTTRVYGPSGAPVPDISNSGATPIGENDLESIHSISVGGTAQLNYTGQLFERDNHLAFGGSIDRAQTDFQSRTEVGVVDSSLMVQPGYFVATPEGTGFNATPVTLGAASNDCGLFATDTFELTPALAVTASGRYNIAEIDLTDRGGSNLTGNNRYSRFNPAAGATFKVNPALTAYLGYSEGTRTPTPSEIECSNPLQPCLLPSSLSSDPPTLKQVVSCTYELGLRGAFGLAKMVPGRFSWNLGVFRTDLTDDIYGVATSLNSGFFENIVSTRRQGIEARLDYKDEGWLVYAAYSLVDATFQSPLTIPSPNNPFADGNGDIQVQPGDHLPGIPMNQFKFGADYRLTKHWTVGATLISMGAQFYRGDESNQNPELPGYQVVNLHSSYAFNKRFETFVGIQNVLDAHYDTFGEFGDPTGVGAPGVPASGADLRFVSPAAPISVSGGIRVKF
jgi:iron complex outermembrane receptor protein